MNIYTHKSRQPLETQNFLQENVLIPYYSADQSILMTDSQHFDKKKEEIIRFKENNV